MPSPTTKAKRPLTFRLPPAALERLRRRAQETGQTQTALAARYIEEGLRTDEHPLVVFREGAAGRRATLLGTRLDVWHVVATVKEAGNSVGEAAAYLELPVDLVAAAVRYYACYPDEIAEWTARATAVAEREEAIWLRQQELLA